jgi:hypothetical protein
MGGILVRQASRLARSLSEAAALRVAIESAPGKQEMFSLALRQ